jgi:hypothetical protein
MIFYLSSCDDLSPESGVRLTRDKRVWNKERKSTPTLSHHPQHLTIIDNDRQRGLHIQRRLLYLPELWRLQGAAFSDLLGRLSLPLP